VARGTILIVEDDLAVRDLLARDAAARGYAAVAAATLAQVNATAAKTPPLLALVDLDLGGESGLDAIGAIHSHAPDAEIVVISATTSLASAIASYDLNAFAFVPKPFDLDQLFATVERAVEHRRVRLANRRLIWEQRLINEIGDDLRYLQAPEQLLQRVLGRLTRELDLQATAARLQNPKTGAFDMLVAAAPDDVRAAWSTHPPALPRPSDRVLASRKAVRIADLRAGGDAGMPASLRSALAVPMFAGDTLLGVLSIGSAIPERFSEEDERLLGIIANQTAVGVQNARLHVSLESGKQEWEAAFDAIGDPIAVFDAQGRLLRGNAALASYAGRAVTALRGLTCDDLGLCGGVFPECAVGRAAGAACVHAQVTRPGERIFSVTTCPVADAADGAAIVQIAKDVTLDILNARRMQQMSDEIVATNNRLLATVERLKSTQAQLLQAEKLSAIGQLVAGVAHELNNPLTSVIGYAQLLQEEATEAAAADPPRVPDGLAHDLRRVAEESERAARIVRNLLAFARRQSAARAEQDVPELIARVIALRSYQLRLNSIQLETAFSPALPPVLGDAGQLQQALLNLLLNAEQAMHARAVRRVTVGARYVAAAHAVEMFIVDSGHGIPEENLRRIFDPFFTTREVGEGTGLGLSICYGIVRDHGGQICAESRPGHGARFRILLPARGQDDPLRVLVAHRDQTERDYLSAALTGWGHEVVAVDTAAEARARLAAGGLDVAFIDHGFAAAAREASIDGAGPHTMVIQLSEAGSAEGVPAPFELAALHASLRGMPKACA
jgi:two-component system NtrC family sensor kinase